MPSYNFPAMTTALSSMSLAEIKRQLHRARRLAVEIGTPGAHAYRAAVEGAIAEKGHHDDVAATPATIGVSLEDTEWLWHGIEYTESVLTGLNPVGRNGNRRKHLLSRTRGKIKRVGAGTFLLEEYSANERTGRMPASWARNIWATLSTGRSDLVKETWILQNAARFSGEKVGTAHDMILALWPIFGLDVPPRPNHAAPVNERAVARMRRLVTKELISLGSQHGVKLPDTPVFTVESLSLVAERRAALERAGYRCEHSGCGVSDLTMLHVHHVVHRAHRGSDSRDNLRVLCANHHAAEHRRRKAE